MSPPPAAIPGTALRPAGTADAETLAQIHATAFAGTAAWDADALARLAETPGVFALMEASAPPAGFILMRLVADEAEVLTLAVRPEARRQGVAAALLEAALAHALAAGIARCFLEVAENNAAARALYERHGFSETGRRPGYYRSGAEDALVLCWTAPPKPHLQ